MVKYIAMVKLCHRSMYQKKGIRLEVCTYFSGLEPVHTLQEALVARAEVLGWTEFYSTNEYLTLMSTLRTTSLP
jgi:hypothetical protein